MYCFACSKKKSSSVCHNRQRVQEKVTPGGVCSASEMEAIVKNTTQGIWPQLFWAVTSMQLRTGFQSSAVPFLYQFLQFLSYTSVILMQ